MDAETRIQNVCYLIFSKNLAAWGSNGKTMMDVNTLKIV
jgi:hypothetical protein